MTYRPIAFSKTKRGQFTFSVKFLTKHETVYRFRYGPPESGLCFYAVDYLALQKGLLPWDEYEEPSLNNVLAKTKKPIDKDTEKQEFQILFVLEQLSRGNYPTKCDGIPKVPLTMTSIIQYLQQPMGQESVIKYKKRL